MQNLLNLLRAKFKARKAADERAYRYKVKYLYLKTYAHYMRELAKNQPQGVIDIPYFLTGSNISMQARKYAICALNDAIKKGRKHINKCYKRSLLAA